MSHERFTAVLDLDRNYRFDVRLDGDPPVEFQVDEAPPLGAGEGPNPARMLATAVGHCLGSSLSFCLGKARVELQGLRVKVEGTFTRNDRGRLRIGSLAVQLEPGLAPEDRARAARCLEVFEDYCIVTESVRAGVPVTVTTALVEPAQAAGR